MQRARPQDDIALLPAAVYDPTEVDSRRAASDSNALQALARVATHHRQVGTDSGTCLLIPASPSPRKRPRLSVIGDKNSPADEWEDDFVGAKDSKRHGGPHTFSRSDHCERGKGKDRATFDHAGLISTEPVRQSSQSKLLKGLDKIHQVKSNSEGRRRESTRSSSFALFDRRAAGVASTFQKMDGVDRPGKQPKSRKGKEPVDPLVELRGKGGKIARFCSAQHHLRKATVNTLAAPKTTRSETYARPDGPTDVAGHDEKDEADDLDVIGAPNNPTKRTRDGKVIEHLQLGPLAHPPVPGDPEYATIEPYSKIRLRPGSRCIPHEDLQHHFSDRYHLSPSLLYSCARHQRGTDEVDVELDADFIVVGVLAWKGPVKVTNPNAKEGTRERKNLRFTLVDLSTPEASSSGHGLLNVILFEAYSVDNRIEADGYQVPVYQGGSGGAYEKFWKESVGAVVAILNPRILKPRQDPGKSNVYTLVPQNAESMMVIGRAQDLSTCKARKANGSPCDEWCDGRVNKYCQYHVHRAVKSTGVRRPETANVTSSLSTTSTFNPSEFERQFVPSAKTRAARFAIKDEYDPMRKIGLLPRDNTSLDDGVKTYVTRSRSSKQFVDNNPGRIKAVIASELRHAAITSGNGSGGYVQGIRDGPTLADLEKSRASKRKEQQTAERELKALLQHDQGETLGGQYLARRTVPAEASLTANGQVDNSTVEPKPKKSTPKSFGEETFGPPAAPAERRAFSTLAVRLIGYDPTKAGDEDEEVGDASRGKKARQLEEIMALPRGQKRFKAGGSDTKAVAPKAVPPRPSHSRSPSRSLESDSDLSIEGGPQK